VMRSREETLFQAAAALTGPERAVFLDRECAGDPALRARLDALLAAHERPDGVLASHTEPTRPTITLHLPDLPDPAVGMTIGRYKLLEKLGEGGCGVVYVAEQTEPVHRRVALKVIKLGMDTREVIARFEAERQALAMMDHPNIAKVLDAGTTEAGISQNPNSQSGIPTGRPYFVMELVRGIRITDYCARHSLTTQERLDLFIKVCQAIQHAHQKGIIHRDIKPSNILVTLHDGVPVPKVIDFGIAKATEGRLTDSTVYTQLHQFIGTPAYMSPEQAEMSGLDIDTRSDIYSLGVLLYELLTGATPFDAKELIASGIDAMRKTIREKEPLRPSTRLRQTKASGASRSAAPHATQANDDAQSQIVSPQSQIDPDLDWIVMKCLEKDRGRRYETANGLAMDLSRHLNTEPVIARPPSAVYRFQKAFRRNKLAFAAASLVVTALVIGIGVATWRTVQTGYAQRETEAALRRETAALAEVSRAKEALEEALRTAQRTTYIRGIALVHQEWLAGNVARAQTLLEECGPEELRDFEWHYLRGLCQGRGSQIIKGQLDAQSMSASAYGHEAVPLATINRSVMDALTGEEIFSFRLATNRLRWDAFALSPTGDYFAIVEGSELGHDKGIAIWDRRSRRYLRAIAIPPLHSINSIAFSPDGRTLAAGVVCFASASPDVWQSVAGRVMRWDVNTGEPKGFISLQSHSVQRIAFTRDGKGIIGLHGHKFLTIWDATSGAQLRTLEFSDHWLLGFALSPDGRQIAFSGGCAGGVLVVDLGSGNEAWKFFGHTDNITAVAYSPDGQWFAAGNMLGVVRVWDTTAGRQKRVFRQSTSIAAVGFSPDSRQLLIGNGGVGGAGNKYTVWNMDATQEVKELYQHQRPLSTVSFSPDRQLLATTGFDGNVTLWDLAEDRLSVTLGGHVGLVYGFSFSPRGQHVATAGSDGTVRLWDRRTGELLKLVSDHPFPVSAVAYSPDGSLLAAAGGESTIMVRNSHSGELLLEFTCPRRPSASSWGSIASTVVFSPDGREIASAVNDTVVHIWNRTDGQERRALLHQGTVYSAAYRSDGQVIATCTATGEVKLWSAASGEEILNIKGHLGKVWGVALTPDGQRIATASDRGVRIFDTVSGLEVLALPGGYNVVAFCPDGRLLAAGGGIDGWVRLWGWTPKPLEQ
jgi:eukaryotic-like serine/threonine-protein kinase